MAIFAYGAVIDDSVEAMRSARTIAAWCRVSGLVTAVPKCSFGAHVEARVRYE